MTEVQRILKQHQLALHGSAWHGDAVWQILGPVTPEQAHARPLATAHTIWELVEHMTYWESTVCRRLQMLEPLPESEFNFPRMPAPSAANWQAALQRLRESNAEFHEIVQGLDDSDLEKPLSSAQNTVYVELHGVIQHHLYHAGQIALLRNIPCENQAETRL